MNEPLTRVAGTVGDPPSSSAPSSKDDQLAGFVTGRVSALQAGLLRGTGSGPAADLARLRRGLGRAPGEAADAWGLVVNGLPDDLAGRGDAPSPWEVAAHVALTTFALHQQASSTAMHVTGPSLGAAVRRLAGGGASEDAVKRRFDVLVTASSTADASHHLRGLVTQLRQHRIPLDYGRLAVDLRRLWSPTSATGVRLAWGRDFHRRPPSPAETITSADQSRSPSITPSPTTGDL